MGKDEVEVLFKIDIYIKNNVCDVEKCKPASKK